MEEVVFGWSLEMSEIGILLLKPPPFDHLCVHYFPPLVHNASPSTCVSFLVRSCSRKMHKMLSRSSRTSTLRSSTRGCLLRKRIFSKYNSIFFKTSTTPTTAMFAPSGV